MAERPPSSAGGGESNPQLNNPQQFVTSTGAVTPMMVQQQQQQLQQRATPVGRRQQQRAGPYQQQQRNVHPTASEPSVNQVQPGPQVTTAAGTPHFANMSIMPISQQNMQESPPERLYDSAASEDSVGNPENVVPRVAPVTNPVTNPLGVPPIVAPQFDSLNALSPVVDEHDPNQELPPEPDVEPDTKQETVRQKANQVQTPYMGALPQQILGASRQSDPLTSQQPQQQKRQYRQPQQAQQQARPQMVPTTSLATDNQARAGTPGAAAQPQNSIPSSAPAATAAPTEPLDATRSNLQSKRSIQDLLAQIDPRVTLDPNLEDVMLKIADDFIERVASGSGKLAKHRRSDVLEAKDVQLHLEKDWNIKGFGFGGDEERPSVSETRLAVVRNSAAAGQAAAVDTKSSSLLASAPGAVNASTLVKPAGAAAGSPLPSPSSSPGAVNASTPVKPPVAAAGSPPPSPGTPRISPE